MTPVILVIDDDEYVHLTVAAALRVLHPDVVGAATAVAGIQLAVELRPDLVIVDVGLPDLDGYAVTRAIRARPELATIRICILTGHAPDEALAREAGADALVAKPFRLEALRAMVRSQLAIRTRS